MDSGNLAMEKQYYVSMKVDIHSSLNTNPYDDM